ncbi:phage baseplate assembly protein V [Labrys sp. ZIDIC5]|uniref:phage baseplate assembly protein V n=1 Tax=Labrys sedimenti TaxID=3106036 RepID=UPI002AC9F2ED|nr:phage baseplate assembly protein V [Labrys sp. ZIDIC5]MDZ5448964.1 phage baseplate assembly protein V [Labrys sp. ZIDIC5]
MSEFQDYLHREIDRHLARRSGIKAATITSYDPKRHAIKATIQPDGFETGWFPHSVAHVGNGFGIVAGPTPGDQIMVGFIDGDLESPVNLGRVHSDKERPPVAESGEVVIQSKGVTIKIDKDGNIGITGGAGLNFTGQNIKLSGNVAIEGGTLTHEGVNIGHDHEHTAVQPGPANTGPPVS